jgi:hypothetical protein
MLAPEPVLVSASGTVEVDIRTSKSILDSSPLPSVPHLRLRRSRPRHRTALPRSLRPSSLDHVPQPTHRRFSGFHGLFVLMSAVGVQSWYDAVSEW